MVSFTYQLLQKSVQLVSFQGHINPELYSKVIHNAQLKNFSILTVYNLPKHENSIQWKQGRREAEGTWEFPQKLTKALSDILVVYIQNKVSSTHQFSF
jgi:hypothetical protein